MAGWLIYNGFWNPQGPPDVVCRLRDAAAARGLHWPAVPNTSLTAELAGDGGIAVLGGPVLGDFVLFWDKDVRLAKTLEAAGMRVYNTAAAVEVCDDKAATHLALAREGIPMPRTLVAPMTYREYTAQGEEFLRRGEEALGYPLVVKECYGSLGGQVHLARSAEELRALAAGMDARPFMLQRFVAASAGTDARLYVVGGRVAAAMRRRSDTDFRANLGGGGQGEAYTPTQEEAALAVRCCRILGADWAGVDLLWDEGGRPLVCEVNSNAMVAGITACTGVDVAGEIVEYVLDREREMDRV